MTPSPDPMPRPTSVAARAATGGATRAAPLAAVLCAALAFAAAAVPAAADGLVHELKAGILAHDVPDLWSGFRLEDNAADLNLEVSFSPTLPFLFGVLRPAIGASINTRGDTSHAYLDARWEIELSPRLFLATGLGAAIHDGETGPVAPDKKALGSRVLFHIPIELGVRLDGRNSLSVYFEHISNGYTQDFNEGLDRIGVRYGYRF